jgi:hypothetical protein
MSTEIIIKPKSDPPVGATLMKTGQTTSYRTGDDGDIEAGRVTSFSVLESNNPFGNTNRFTDTTGAQTYSNSIVIDWSTYNGTNVLGYYRVISGNILWNDAIDQSLALSIGTYTSGWRLGNRKEILNLSNDELADSFNYAPFNLTGFTYWTSTTWKNTTTNAFTVSAAGICTVAAKAGASGRRFSVRTFTVTGTTLT